MGLTAEIGIVYRKQVKALRQEIDQVHPQIERHIQNIQSIRQATEETKDRMTALGREKVGTQAEVNIARQQLTEIEERIKRQRPTLLLFELDGEER